jgi:NifB/MoaA-like Fe-S oxidoreductase
MVRSFLEGSRSLKPRRKKLATPKKVLLLTGEAFYPYLSEFAASYKMVEGLTVSVTAVPNRFFGEQVTVAGLMTGVDVTKSVSEQPQTDVVILPSVCLNRGRFLDGMTLEDASHSCSRQIIAVETDPIQLHERIMAP